MNREVWDRWCERGILGSVLIILVLGPLALGGVRAFEFAIIQVLTSVVMGLWVTRIWLSPKMRLLWPPVCWAVVAFVIYSIVRYRYADVEYLARLEMIRVLVYGCLFLAILNNLHRQETIQVISFVLLFLAMAISFYAIYQFLKGSDRVWTFIKPYPHRGSGTYINPNHLAGFLEMLLPLGLAYTLTARLKPVTRVILGYVSLALVAGIGVSVSKGSWISTGLALVLFFAVLFFQRRYRIPALALGLFSIVDKIVTPCSFLEIVNPKPPNSPRVSFSRSLRSSGSKNWLCGSRCGSIAWRAEYNSFL